MHEISLLEIIAIGLSLSMDCFAVSISASTGCYQLKIRDYLRTAFMFGLFQGMMPLAGWALGFNFREIISSFDHWVAFVALAGIGGKMIYESLTAKPGGNSFSLNKRWVLLGLAVATSIDALVAGISLAVLNVSILFAALSFASITFVVTLGGLYIGRKTRRLILGKRAEIAGGLMLILLAIKIIIDHKALM